jgi:YgiT-type zinc finger domain-containing protein
MKCPICKAPMEEELLVYELEHEGEKLRLEDVPTWVCPQCDHTLVEEAVIETVEDMLSHMDTLGSAGAGEEE